MHDRNFECAVESNGTQPAPADLDWICVSPKAGAPMALSNGNELKLVYPQADLDPASLEKMDFDYWWLQPMDGPDRAANTTAAVAYCLEHTRWRLSLQTHKFIGIPCCSNSANSFASRRHRLCTERSMLCPVAGCTAIPTAPR